MSNKKQQSNKMGGLVASAEVQLHSVETVKLWNPSKRSKAPGVGLFFQRLSTLEHAARHDDPYADFALLEIERAINAAFALCQSTLDVLPQRNSSRILYHETLSRAPVKKSVSVKTRFGWRLLALLEQFDIAMVQLSDAHFKAQMTRSDFEQHRLACLKALRGIISMSVTFQHSGVTRQDVTDNNAKAQAAQAKLGAIPFEVLEGVDRAEFAPVIKVSHG
ncbi:PFL_4669 family integrating conjugative element protein [Vibrio sp. 10N.261.51.A1]|uniref:Integrating conjugative element protein n=3 Tax=Vibrio TaxID=662 RepID=A0A7Z1MHB7_9VIBR|nr:MULTISPECIES: TIGR03761 family integrating conjugative element protein [Vibrio]PMK74288.1 integrating conjugative element protein [Vibrio sp. 10N.261.52.E5]PMP17130.1 integrating conjugative element protein [Vibrio cyclitrophicus]PMP26136.1 integrating conjugative element protein [Vibrio cyclitrophicus]TKF84816.1 TIGR03761 family integrating conjugative element protein [Vibrio sp. F13]